MNSKCLNECLARCEDDKSTSLGKYAAPSALYELGSYYVDEKDFQSAKTSLAKGATYKDYELDNRIQVQIRSLQRKIKYLTEPPKQPPKAAEADNNSNHEEIHKQKNFFIS